MIYQRQLNAAQQEVISLRRAFPQKVKPVSCDQSGSEAVLEQPRQSSQGTSRNVRTSAAMLGLALSMGVSSLLIPRHDDQASAAEPRFAESELRVASPESESIPLQTAVESSPLKPKPASVWVGETFSHRVSQGQTLRSIARQYRTSLRSLVNANGIAPSAIVQIGQTIQIPASPAALSALRESRSVASLPRFDQSSSESNGFKSPASGSLNTVISGTAPRGLSRLRLQREQLRDSLAGLGSDQGSNYLGNSPSKAITPLPTSGLNSESSADFRSRFVAETPGLAPSASATTYHVKPGDTLGAIARAYDVPQRVLQAVNQLADPNVLRVSQPLVVPVSEVASVDTYSPATTLSPGLAASQGVTASANVLATAGQSPGAAQTIAYRVTFGETLAQIAQQNGVSKETLVQTNRISNPDFIRVGQVIQIPDSISVASVPAVASAGTVIPAVDESVPSTQSFGSGSPAISALPASILVSAPTVPADTVPALAPPSPVQTAGTAIFSTEFVGLDQAHASVSTYTNPPRVVQPHQEPASQPASANQRSFSHLQQLIEDVASMRRYTESRSVERTDVSNQLAVVNVQPLVAATVSQSPAIPTSDVLQSFAAVGGSSQESVSAQQAIVEEPTAVSVADAQLPQTASPADATPQLVATASLGSESYSPLLEPLVGRMVSPELPALAGAEAFLPQGSANFNGYIWPARGVLTSGYGWRWGRMHRGIDIAAPVGTPIMAAASGVVQYSGWNSGGYGYMVDIRHPDGSMTRYAHNSRLLVRVGQEVDQGEQIAAMGSTGYSTGPHVHFEVHLPNQGAVNPATYLARR